MGNKRREGVEEEKKKVEEGGQVKNEAVVFAGDRRQLRNVNNNKTNNENNGFILDGTPSISFSPLQPPLFSCSPWLCCLFLIAFAFLWDWFCD